MWRVRGLSRISLSYNVLPLFSADASIYVSFSPSYILADGGRIAASGPSEFVRVLREGSWFDSGCTDGEYMVNFSGRYRELHGVTVRTDTPEHFMDDLKKYGYIKG